MCGCERWAGGYASSTATPFLTGFTNPLALTLSADGALLVGDWTSRKAYRIARV